MLFLTRQLARIIGLLLLILGVLGFFTNGFIAGIGVNVGLNVFNIVVGLLGIASARTFGYAKNYLRIFGLLFTIFGVVFFINGNVWGLLNTNQAGALMYLIGGLGMLIAASVLRPKTL